MDCIWEPFENKYKCKYCGFVVPNNAFKKNCGKDKEVPGIVQRLTNLGKAVVDHVATGMQHCSEEQRQGRLQICQSNKCNLFRQYEGSNTGVCAHEDCGCLVRSNGKFMDKLSWATSRCPVGLWGPIEIKNLQNDQNGV